uniref:Small ribosomal subunit protein uS14m n=2 Tax=Roya TaxID=43942 RepID=A0A6G9IET4_9VIRI|nr:ribosomal protein S14 [Roya obtusa]YP_009755730.1 ribosomal protein S14 [Roya anglica]AGZ90390.1 ribosomal protein S14 [Roya obtusa]QIQ22969.1 ribosomal protein S14 [Roya anglica]
MSNQLIRDKLKRRIMLKHELKRIEYKSICEDRNIPISTRYQSFLKLSKLPRNSSKTRIRNRCIISGRSRSVYKVFRMSRIVFRDLASKGSILGISKASW